RDERHQMAIRKALADGIVDVVASDHAPHTTEEKEKTYPGSPSGLTGVQTIVPVMLNFVNQGLIDLKHLVRLMCVNPCRIFSVKGKGGLFVGQDADFTVVDMDKKQTVTNDWIVSQAGWSPYNGHELHGWPVKTIIRGELIVDDGNVLKQDGRPMEFYSQ
ncbi:MAG: amidohydrolase family protein, partial [Pseudomonadota bacterium]